MATGNQIHRVRHSVRRHANTTIALSVAVVSAVLGAATCVAWVGVGPFVDDIGCWHYIAFTTILPTAIAAMSMEHFDKVPGYGFLSRISVIGLAMFAVFNLGTAMPTVAPITKPVGVFVNVAYYAVMALILLWVTLFLQFYLTEGSEVERQYHEFTNAAS